MAEGRFVPKSTSLDEALASATLKAECVYRRIGPHFDCEGRVTGSPGSLWVLTGCALRNDITQADVADALAELHDAKLIVWYTVDGKQYVADPTFVKSQRGLRKDREAPSVIPPPPPTPANSGVVPELVRSTPELVPSAPELLRVKEKDKDKEKKKEKSSTTSSPSARMQSDDDPLFADFVKRFPQRLGSNGKASARVKWNARLQDGTPADEILAGTDRYAAQIRSLGKEKTEFVMQMSRFLGKDEYWRDEWPISTGPTSRQPDWAVAAALASEIWTDSVYRELFQSPLHGLAREEGFGARSFARLVENGHYVDIDACRSEILALKLPELARMQDGAGRKELEHRIQRVRRANGSAPRVLAATEMINGLPQLSRGRTLLELGRRYNLLTYNGNSEEYQKRITRRCRSVARLTEAAGDRSFYGRGNSSTAPVCAFARHSGFLIGCSIVNQANLSQVDASRC